MKKILITIILFASILCGQIQAQITATQMGMYDFKVNQNLTADEMNGTTDVTAKLQAAVDAARMVDKTLFIPSGTYKVSNTINCVLTIVNWVMSHPVSIVGSSVNHPVIKLADNTAVFKGSVPKAIFHYQSSDPQSYSTDAVMQGGIRSVDFDLGAGNTKAVALYWGCAQYCFIEDININARDGFAGLTGIGGANQLLANITVIGGQHGLYLPSHAEGVNWGMPEAPQNTITACTFINQTDIPLVLWGWGGITMVGISIVKDSGVAILMKCDSYAPVMQFPFSLTDSKIEFTTPQATNTAIKNILRGTVALRGVYIKGASIICDNNEDENLTTSLLSDWTGVKRYNYIDKAGRNGEPTNILLAGKHFDAIAGVQSNTAIIEQSAATPPVDLTSRHIWAFTPSFEDADAFLVAAGSTAAQIQTAINAHLKIFLAKGTYTLNTPITLKSNTIFCGCPGFGNCGSKFSYGFTPTSQSWLINTVDEASATTYLMDIATNPGVANFKGGIHWMAGKNSIIRTIMIDRGWVDYEYDLTRLYFSGNGGGRIFNYQDEKNPSVGSKNSENHRKVKISGTTQALIFYGLNLERGGSFTFQSSFPCLEIVNSSNIRIFGGKGEIYQPYAKIDNCTNISLTGIIDSGNLNRNKSNQDLIQIVGTNCDKIEISNSFWLNPPSALYKIVADPWNTNTPDRTMHLGLYHRNWATFDSDPLTTFAIVQPTDMENWTFFPNPTNSVFYIQSKSNVNTINKGFIYNSLGEKVKYFTFNNDGTTKIDLSDSVNGIYLVSIQNTEGKKEFFKVIKN